MRFTQVLAFVLSAAALSAQEKPEFSERKKDAEWREAGQPAAAPAFRIDAGTKIAVRLREEIKSDSAFAGRTFAANVDADVRGALGDVLIPRGSEARVILREFTEDPKLTESARMTLDLESVTTGGATHTLRTRDLVRTGKDSVGANKRTGVFVGGATAVGAAIGGIAGGGKGAAIGALAGAAAGAAAQVFTRDKNLTIPVETLLEFTVEEAAEAGR